MPRTWYWIFNAISLTSSISNSGSKVAQTYGFISSTAAGFWKFLFVVNHKTKSG